jgi:signal transduction histidine kinase
VLRNLVGNAHEYGREGGRIALQLERRPREVCVAVADNGPGIAADEQERIFQRFYRASGQRGDGPAGSGLGLPIARALLELHGGTLTLESRVGQGSAFRVRLPVH